MGHLLLLLAVQVGMGKALAQEQIYGSGDFILNNETVYSDTGTLIGGTVTQGSTGYSTEAVGAIRDSEIRDSLLYWINQGWDPLFHVRYDYLPHSINASAVNGTVTRSPDLAVYEYNTPVILTATPDAGYIFDKWTQEFENTTPNRWDFVPLRNADFCNSTILLKAISNYKMVAHFVPMTRIILVSAVDLSWNQQAVGGTSGGTFKITNTGNAPLTVASIDYPAGFNGSWEGTIAPGSAKEITVNFAPTVSGIFSGNITVNSDATAGAFTLPVTAVAQHAYSLTGTSSFSALITSPVSRTFWQGSTVTLRAMSVAGYVFMNWTEDQKILSTDANFDLEITREHQVWANYLPVSRTLKVSITRSSGLRKVGTMYRGSISVKNTGTAPVFLSHLRIQGKGTGRILVSGRGCGWINPGSTQSVKISFTPSWMSFYRLRVFAIAEDLTSPVEWAELRR